MVGSAIGVTRDRVRQIELQALHTMGLVEDRKKRREPAKRPLVVLKRDRILECLGAIPKESRYEDAVPAMRRCGVMLRQPSFRRYMVKAHPEYGEIYPTPLRMNKRA